MQTQAETDTAAEQADTQAITALLEAAKRKVRRRKFKFWGSLALLEGTNLLVFVPGMAYFRSVGATLLLPFLVTFIVILLALFAAMLRVAFTPLDFDAEELSRLGGVRAIPPLLDALSSGTMPTVRKAIYRALTSLMPRLRATDANLLTAGHRRTLNYLLNAEALGGIARRSELDFILAVLKAYEQVGDAKAIPIVTKLTKQKAGNERQRLIQQAARSACPCSSPIRFRSTAIRPCSAPPAAAKPPAMCCCGLRLALRPFLLTNCCAFRRIRSRPQSKIRRLRLRHRSKHLISGALRGSPGRAARFRLFRRGGDALTGHNVIDLNNRSGHALDRVRMYSVGASLDS